MMRALPLMRRNRKRTYNPVSSITFNDIDRSQHNGFWFDSSDYSTTFQDRFGSRQVTGPGQPVGLRLDKWTPQPVNPPNLISAANWIFSATTAIDCTFSIVGELITVTNVGSSQSRCDQSFTSVAGKWYKFTCPNLGTVTDLTIRIGVTQGGTTIVTNTTISTTAPGGTSVYFQATGAVTWIRFFKNGGNYSFSNATLVEYPGFHARANSDSNRGTSTVRPKSGVRNLLPLSGFTGHTTGTVGSGGVMPSNISLLQAAGLAARIIRVRIDPTSLRNTVELEFTGTPTSSKIEFRVNQISAFVGKTFCSSYYVGVITSSQPPVSWETGITETQTGSILGSDYSSFTPLSTDTRVSIARVTDQPSATNVSGRLIINVTQGVPVNFSFRLSGLQMEESAVVTPHQVANTAYELIEEGETPCKGVYYDGVDDYYPAEAWPTPLAYTDKFDFYFAAYSRGVNTEGVLMSRGAAADCPLVFSPAASGKRISVEYGDVTLESPDSLTFGSYLFSVSGDTSTDLLVIKENNVVKATAVAPLTDVASISSATTRLGSRTTNLLSMFKGEDFGILWCNKVLTGSESTVVAQQFATNLPGVTIP